MEKPKTGDAMLETVYLDVTDIGGETRFEHESTVLVLPHIDREQVDRLAPVLQRRALHPGLLVLVDDTERIGFTKVANLIFAKSSSKYFGYLAQDVFPGDGWLKCGVDMLEKSGKSLLPFSDGRFHGTLAVFGLARRFWVQGLYRNCLFFPGYQRHFGDTELSAIATAQDQIIYNPGCILLEVDYDKHTRPNHPEDDALYRARARTGFGGVVEPFEAA
ncbi:hypothetical protein [Desulfohalovibrio reitneri]|uniref:hypothetical protein n=1 Tax=Desulfohalovibrio reitneri TaxID=1307759 RepID=UPI000A514FC5|nr:hypothetical protein [Desulfohalovibrio reitneri]